MKVIIIHLVLMLIATNCQQQFLSRSAIADTSKPVKGLSFVAPSRPFTSNPMPLVASVGADWIAVIPYGFCRLGDSIVHFDENKQWWGEGKTGCEETIRLAHEANLNVMLKPQIWIPQGWTGDLDFKTDEEWETWEKSYEQYILLFSDIATKNKVDMLCIGTEFKISVQKRPDFWRSLIAKVRIHYQGKIVYAANWDEYQLISFWNDLDYIGINAYFPLVEEATPSIPSLRKAWQPILKNIEKLHTKFDRPVIFTEFGYLSTDGCAYNTWELERTMREMPINEQAQANAYEGLFDTFWQKTWWHGGFMWKWFPEPPKPESRQYRDYTPQGKLGEQVLKRWYSGATAKEVQ